MSFGSFMKDFGHGFTGTISKVVSAPFNLAGKAISGATGAVVGIANAGAKATGSIFSGILQAPGAIFAAYVRFGMNRPEIFTAPMLKYYAVVGASSVASSFVWHQINTGPIEDQNLVYGLTGESFLQARVCRRGPGGEEDAGEGPVDSVPCSSQSRLLQPPWRNQTV